MSDDSAFDDDTTTIPATDCFAEGTCLETRRGMVAVEDLEVGDEVWTLLGGLTSKVRWIGRRRIDCRRHPRPIEVMPVRVRQDAFDTGSPSRDVLLSPDHAVYVDDVLVPVRALMNGITIATCEVAEITYFHIELEQHDVVFADGLAAESCLDTGNRSAFSNGGAVVMLAPSFGARRNAQTCCAPVVSGKRALAPLRKRLAARAAQLKERADNQDNRRPSRPGDHR